VRFEAEAGADKKKIEADALLYAAEKEAEGIRVKRLAEAQGQKAMVDAWGGDGSRFIVASRLADVLKGANLIPLETLFGGAGGGDAGQGGPIRYHNTLDLLNFFKLDELNRHTGLNASSD
jgi:hypothetical protein